MSSVVAAIGIDNCLGIHRGGASDLIYLRNSGRHVILGYGEGPGCRSVNFDCESLVRSLRCI